MLLVRLILLAASLFLLAPESYAFPSFEDFWRYTCSPGGFNKRAFAKAKRQSNEAGVTGAIGTLDLACVQSAREIAIYLNAYKKWQNSTDSKPEPKFNNRVSRVLIGKAFNKLFGQYKKQKQNPELLYNLGIAYALKGDVWAVNRLDEVSNKFSSSRRAPFATLALAEFFFDKDGLARAQRYYDRAARVKNPAIKFYRQYKMAWVDYATGAQTNNRAKQKSGLYELAKLYTGAKRRRGPIKAFSRSIRSDVIDLTTEYGDINETRKLLKIVDAEDDYIKLIERMATAKIQSGQFPQAYKLYAMVLKENAKSPRAPELQQKLIQLAAEMGNYKALVINLKLMLQNYGYAKSDWQKANSKRPQMLIKTEKLIEDLIYEYAVALDNDGRQNNNAQNLAYGIELYNLYLKRYSASKRAYEVKFYQAQILYLRQKPLESAKAFLSLIKQNPKGKFLNDSLEIMVTAAQVAYENDKKQYKLPQPGAAKKPQQIPEIRQVYADSLNLFSKYKPQDPNTVAMLYTSASIYYDFGHYRRANKDYLRFITKYPNNQFAVNAVARVFEYHRLQATKREYEQLKKLIARYPTLKASQDLAFYFQLPKPEPKQAPADREENAVMTAKADGGEDESGEQEAQAAAQGQSQGEDP